MAQSLGGSELTFGQIDDDCLDRERFVTRVLEVLGPNPVPSSAPSHLDIAIVRAGADSMRATLRVRQRDGRTASRVTTAYRSECLDLAETLALQVAVAIDPMVALRSIAEPSPAPSTTAEPPSAPNVNEAPAPQPHVTPSESLRFHAAGVGVGSITGIVPGVALFGEVRMELRYEAWTPTAMLHASLPSHEDFRSGAVAVTHAGVEIDLCRIIGRGQLCAGLDVGAVWGTGQGYRDPSTEVVPLMSAVLGYAHELRIASGFSLVPRIVIGAPLWSATFDVDNSAAFRTAAILGAVSVAAMFGGE